MTWDDAFSSLSSLSLPPSLILPLSSSSSSPSSSTSPSSSSSPSSSFFSLFLITGTKTEISLSRQASATPKPPPMNYRVNLISPQPLSCWGQKKDKRVAENPLFPVIMPGSDTSLELRAIFVSLSKTDSSSFTHQEISSIVCRDRSTISEILSHYKTHRTLSSTSCPGRPPKDSPRDQ